jgi:hypothetical protein
LIAICSFGADLICALNTDARPLNLGCSLKISFVIVGTDNVSGICVGLVIGVVSIGCIDCICDSGDGVTGAVGVVGVNDVSADAVGVACVVDVA